MLYIHNCYRTARLKGHFVTYLDIQKYLIFNCLCSCPRFSWWTFLENKYTCIVAISRQRPTTNIKSDMVCVQLIEITECLESSIYYHHYRSTNNNKYIDRLVTRGVDNILTLGRRTLRR